MGMSRNSSFTHRGQFTVSREGEVIKASSVCARINNPYSEPASQVPRQQDCVPFGTVSGSNNGS